MNDPEPRLLNLNPIGYVRTEKRNKFDAPSQPDASSNETNWIELIDGQNFELALQDLEGFDKIWLIWWFDRNLHWRPRVMPPRGPAKRRGVFATRSPHRPNPIGLTCVTLLKVESRVLTIGPLDLVDGTPILDIKPYLRTVDAHPEASLGWLESVENQEKTNPSFEIELTAEATAELEWLRSNFGVDFTERAFAILRTDPSPHRTRRILKIEPNLFRIACGAWRMFYTIRGQTVSIQRIERGYSQESLNAEGYEKILDREAQIAFSEWKTRGRKT